MTQRHSHRMPFGARLPASGGVEFALWAPGVDTVVLEHGTHGGLEAHAMARETSGWHRSVLPQARAGDHYRYRMPDGLVVPDPASRFNPHDIHGASQVIDPNAYRWQDGDWRGRPWHEAVVYELHVGTFTPEGTFAAARQRLPYLAGLGITAVELMPLADFPGRRGWGYDGVLPYAPDACYGTPDELKALVDSAHGLGLMVLIDVVYNHFGPEGNYLHAYCPEFFNPAHTTPWGSAINFDGALSRTVRDFFVHNALYWVEEFRFDGLRMDAVHAIRDDSQPHIAAEICAALRAGPGRERQLHVVLENDTNKASMLARDADGVPVAGTAQWNDDIHHAAHVLTTGETDGYYIDFADAPLALFGRALAQGFIYQGQASVFRDRAPRGEPTAGLPLTAFVSFLQTHDQVGNRAFGERLHQLGNSYKVRAALACVLLSPHVPMLFMGEEFAASTPFLYFCDFGAELAEAVSNGRREEFRGFAAFADEAARAAIPDPNDESTFHASRLDWDEITRPPHAEWLAWVGDVLAVRHAQLVPLLASTVGTGQFRSAGDSLWVDWSVGAAGGGGACTRLRLLAHFGDQPVELPALAGAPLYQMGRTDAGGGGWTLAPGAVVLCREDASDG